MTDKLRKQLLKRKESLTLALKQLTGEVIFKNENDSSRKGSAKNTNDTPEKMADTVSHKKHDKDKSSTPETKKEDNTKKDSNKKSASQMVVPLPSLQNKTSQDKIVTANKSQAPLIDVDANTKKKKKQPEKK